MSFRENITFEQLLQNTNVVLIFFFSIYIGFIYIRIMGRNLEKIDEYSMRWYIYGIQIFVRFKFIQKMILIKKKEYG